MSASPEAPARVLLVEDTPEDALLVEHSLGAAPGGQSFAVDHVPTMSAALERLAEADFDVVLLDLGLPDAAGLGSIRRVREAEPETPIIVLTSVDDRDVSAEVVSAGADDYVPKTAIHHGQLYRSLRYTKDRRDRLEEMRHLESRLQQSQRLEAIGRLAGGIAHDFNNILTTILATVSLVEDEARGIAPGLLEDLALVRSQAERASGLTAQLLAFGRRQAMKARPLDLGAAVRGLRTMLQRILGEEIRLHVEAEPGAVVSIDPVQLEQVIINLAINARDAMPHGGVLRFRVSEAAPDLPAELIGAGEGGGGEAPAAPDGWARVDVVDTGEGMEEAVRRRAIEPFFTTKPLGKGSGLGLSSVYGIVAQSGGDMAIDSQPGTGTTVTFFLPLVEADPAEVVGSRERSEPPADLPSRVLLVEDNEAVRRVLAKVLTRHGLEVVKASDPRDALRRFEAGERFDAIVSDVIMPHMRGPEMIALLDASGHRLPVVFMSGNSAEELDFSGVLDRGRFLPKPVDPADLLAALAEVLADA